MHLFYETTDSWFVIKSLCFVDFIYHEPKDYIVFYIYGMREIGEVIRNISFVHLWKYFYGNGTWIKFKLKLNMSLFRQHYQKGTKAKLK